MKRPDWELLRGHYSTKTRSVTKTGDTFSVVRVTDKAVYLTSERHLARLCLSLSLSRKQTRRGRGNYTHVGNEPGNELEC